VPDERVRAWSPTPSPSERLRAEVGIESTLEAIGVDEHGS
jgi:hypothetical protein